jgi:hypothetical protein
VAYGAAPRYPSGEIIGVEAIGEAQRDQVPPLFGGVQAIDHEDILQAAPVESPNDGAADKARAAGNDDSSVIEVVHRCEGQ